jgi:hypothetical protein
MKPTLDRRGKDRWDMEHEQERQQVIHIGQEIYRQRLVAGTWGNISCRLEPTEHILITPSGMPYATDRWQPPEMYHRRLKAPAYALA